MTTLATEPAIPLARSVSVTDERLTVELQDGRSITAPIVWYPRLLHGTPQERNHWEIIAGGEGIHWPELNEDLSVASILEGRSSRESPRSIKKWLEERAAKSA